MSSGTHACLSSHTFRRLLKTQCFEQPSVPPSGSHKCLRFGLWPTLHTTKDFIYLLTYLSYISIMKTMNWS